MRAKCAPTTYFNSYNYCNTVFRYSPISHIKTHGCVSCSQIRVRETLCVIYSNQLSAVYNTKTTGPILIKITSRCPTVSLTYVSNLKGIGPAVPEIRASKSRPNFFVFFFFFATLFNPF